MADINFLPSDLKKPPKEEKKIRQVEYTNPEMEKKQKPTTHGGILSIFSKRAKLKDVVAPPPPPTQKKSTEPLVQEHGGPQKREVKTVITFQEPEKKKKKEQQKKNSRPGFFSRLFSRKEKKSELATPSGFMPDPNAPSYVAQTMAPEPQKNREERMLRGKSFGSRSAYQPSNNDAATRTPEKPRMAPPPPFNPFSKPLPPPPVPPVKEKFEVKNQPPPFAKPPLPPRSSQQPVGSPEQPMQVVPPAPKPGLMFDVNLVPDELTQKKRSLSKLTWLALVFVISVAVVAASYFGIAFYKESIASRAERLDDDIERIKQQIKVLEPIQLDALVLKKRTEEIKKLLDSHVHWTTFFSKLETHTLERVQIKNVIANKDGTVTISATALQPEFAYEQLRVFENAEGFIASVSMTTPTIPVRADDTDSAAPTTSSNIFIPVPTTETPGTAVPVSDFSFQIQLDRSLLYSANTLESEL